jgi:hypothetical protein
MTKAEYVKRADAVNQKIESLYREIERGSTGERFAEIQRELASLEKRAGMLYVGFARNAKISEIESANAELRQNCEPRLGMGSQSLTFCGRTR